jgi:hypothetical protein
MRSSDLSAVLAASFAKKGITILYNNSPVANPEKAYKHN